MGKKKLRWLDGEITAEERASIVNRYSLPSANNDTTNENTIRAAIAHLLPAAKKEADWSRTSAVKVRRRHPIKPAYYYKLDQLESRCREIESSVRDALLLLDLQVDLDIQAGLERTTELREMHRARIFNALGGHYVTVFHRYQIMDAAGELICAFDTTKEVWSRKQPHDIKKEELLKYDLASNHEDAAGAGDEVRE